MRIKDLFEISYKNYKRTFKSNIGMIIIFVVVIVVFNAICMLTNSTRENVESNITGNENLKSICVSTIEDEINHNEYEYIKSIPHVEMIVYNYCISVATEDGNADELEAIGMDKSQLLYFVEDFGDFSNEDIVLNSTFKEKGYNIGDEIAISYNVKLSNYGGMRETSKFKIKAFYEQPVIEDWYDNVIIIKQEKMFEIAAGLYGVSLEDFKNSNLYKQTVLTFVDDIDNVIEVANAIESNGLISSYALEYSKELPTFAKMIIFGGIFIVILLIITGIVVMNSTLNKNIKSRYKEIGIMKSFGFENKHIFGILNIEVFLLWLFIAILATVISLIVVWIIPKMSFFEINNVISFSAFQLIVSILCVYFVMFITAISTIYKASKKNTIEVIRNV